MEKEIKFRAWNNGGNVMHYDFQFIKSGNEGNDWILFTSDKQTLKDDWKNNPFFQMQWNIMQFVGIKDRNEKEIYENDIVIVPAGYGGDMYFKEYVGIVEYDAPDYWIRSRVKKHYGQDFDWGEIEIIGNIYETPELLFTDFK